MHSIAELKLKQRLLKDQMAFLDSKSSKCEELLHRRRAATVQANSPGTAITRRRPREELLKQAAAQSSTFHGMFKEGAGSQNAGHSVSTYGLPRPNAANSQVTNLRQKYLMQELEQSRKQEEAASRRPKPGPGKAGGYEARTVPDTLFPTRYTRNELPCYIEHVSFGLQLTWVAPLNELDYDHYLPLFVEGLCCTEHPFDFMAKQGCKEMLSEAAGSPERVLPSLPKILPMLRTALVTKHPAIVITGLQFLRQLALSSPEVGAALVPYFRMLLGVVNLYVTQRRNLGDDFDYSQGKGARESIGTIALETLETLERCGGPKAFAQIKYMVPTYQSVAAPAR